MCVWVGVVPRRAAPLACPVCTGPLRCVCALQFAVLSKAFCSPVDTEHCVTSKTSTMKEVCVLLSAWGSWLARAPHLPSPAARRPARCPLESLADDTCSAPCPATFQDSFATESGVLDRKTMADMGMRISTLLHAHPLHHAVTPRFPLHAVLSVPLHAVLARTHAGLWACTSHWPILILTLFVCAPRLGRWKNRHARLRAVRQPAQCCCGEAAQEPPLSEPGCAWQLSV